MSFNDLAKKEAAKKKALKDLEPKTPTRIGEGSASETKPDGPSKD